MTGMELAGRTDFQGTPGSLGMTGRVSPEAQHQFAALGWTVYPNGLPHGSASAATITCAPGFP
jgi:hypothetical protein